MKQTCDVENIMADLRSGMEKFENTHYAIILDLRLDIAELIIKGMRRNGVTINQLSCMAGCTEESIASMICSEGDFDIELIARIFHSLEIRAKIVRK